MAEYLNKNLKHLRIVNKISQQELSDKLGINRSTISRIENNEIETTIDNAIKIADAFNISLEDLLTKDLQIKNDSEQKQTMKFGDVEVTLSKDGEITNKDILDIQQFLMQEKIKNDNNQQFD